MYVVNTLFLLCFKIVGGPRILPKVLLYKGSDKELEGMSKCLETVFSFHPASTAAIVDFNATSNQRPVLGPRPCFHEGPL